MLAKRSVTAIRNYMLKHKQTLAVAESVTAGHLQAALSAADRASEFFQGGITVYNLGQKTRHLHIEPIHALSCNCVSDRVATDMANEVCGLFLSDWGIGITGYAAPLPEKGVKELYAHYTFSFKGDVIRSRRLESKKKNSWEVQQQYVTSLLEDLADFLKTYNLPMPENVKRAPYFK
jgi:nicotinamide-nucleotide amidase